MSNNTLTLAISCDTMPQGTLSVEQAQARILESIKPLDDMEYVALLQAAGRILAQPVHAQMNVPPHTNSAMDGYALRHADLAEGVLLKTVGSSFAGRPFAGVVQAGECVRIMTGAVLPAGADTVVMQENVQGEGNAIHVAGGLPCSRQPLWPVQEVGAHHRDKPQLDDCPREVRLPP